MFLDFRLFAKRLAPVTGAFAGVFADRGSC
jgi:hypothetical protein